MATTKIKRTSTRKRKARVKVPNRPVTSGRPKPENKELEKLTIVSTIWKVEQFEKIPHVRKQFARSNDKYLVQVKNKDGQEYWLALAKDQEFGNYQDKDTKQWIETDQYTYRFVKFQQNSKFWGVDFKKYFKYVSDSALSEVQTKHIVSEFNESNVFVNLV